MRAQIELGIVGDDLTGVSTATASVGERMGLSATTTWPGAGYGSVLASCSGVLGVSTGTRDGLGDPAATVAATVTAMRKLGIPMIVKRFDSWLRGSVGVEIVAYRTAGQFDCVFIVGAYPSLLKTTVGGVQMHDGSPVHHSAVGGRVQARAGRASHLPSLLEEAGAADVASIGIAWHQQGGPSRAAAVQSAMQGAEYVVFDAVTHDDLRRVRDELRTRPSVGLACSDVGWAVPHQSSRKARTNTSGEGGALRRNGPVLVVVGSIEQASRRQLEKLRQQPYVMEVGANSVPEPGRDGTRSRVWLLSTPDSSAAVGMPQGSWSRGLAGAADEIVSRWKVSGLVLIGGYTAQAVCSQIGASSISQQRLIGKGTCLGVLTTRHGRVLPVITRSGAVGSSDHLVELAELLARA